jgi:hypothetical protein
MSNLYMASNVTGTEYRRARLVQIINELNQLPEVIFTEETITQLGERTIRGDIAKLRTNYDATKEIDLLNPMTGEPFNAKMTQEQVMVAIYSLYMSLAKDRDDAIA